MGTVHAKQLPNPPDNMSQNPPQFGGDVGDEINNKSRGAFLMSEVKDVKATVDKIHIEGLGRTKDDIVINSIKSLFTAHDFMEVVVKTVDAKAKLENLGCFKNISVFINTSSGEGASPDGVEITFRVRELSRIDGGINTMFGSNEGSVHVSARSPNLLGRGEKLIAEYSYGCKRSNNFHLNFVKPLRGPADATFTSGVFQSSSEQPNSGYKQIDRGLLFDLAFTSAPVVKHNLQWETVWRDLSCLNNTTAFEVREMSGPSLKGALRHILSVDRRDRMIFPRTGTLLQLKTEYAGVGGDVNFFRNEMQFQVNIPIIDDVVLQGSLHGGIVRSLGPKPVSICDNFFLGGPLSIRGFQNRGIGPQAKLNNALGASAYWSGALHLFTPLPFRPKLGGLGNDLRTHFFINAGNIGNFEFTDDYHRNLDLLKTNMRVAYGLGLAARLLGVATVELNYCFPWIYERSDLVNQGLQFGIGVHFL